MVSLWYNFLTAQDTKNQPNQPNQPGKKSWSSFAQQTISSQFGRAWFHWNVCVASDVTLNIFDISHWPKEKKEGRSSNGKHQKRFKWHLMAPHVSMQPRTRRKGKKGRIDLSLWESGRKLPCSKTLLNFYTTAVCYSVFLYITIITSLVWS